MGSLADFSNADGTLNAAALVQMCGLIQCLQNDDRAAAQRLLGQVGTAQIVAYVRDDATLPPDYIGIVDGTDLVVVIIGTMTAAQWMSQITGATAEPYSHQPSVSVGAFWGSIAGPAERFLIASAGPPIRRVKVVGHSYGGAVAQLITFALVDSGFPPSQAQLLTIGAPVPLTSGYTGPQPAVFFRVQFQDDVVPQLPPAGFRPSLSLDTVGSMMMGGGPRWAYYGSGWYVDLTGGLRRNPATRPQLLSAVSTVGQWNLGTHDISYYTRAAVATYQLQAGDPRVDAWLPIAAAQAARPNPQTPPPPIPQASWVNVPGANGVYFPGGPAIITDANLGGIQSVAINAPDGRVQSTTNIQVQSREPLMATWSGFARITFFVNNGRYGRQMRTTLSGVASITEAFNQSKTLAALLAGCLGNALSSYPSPLPVGNYPKGLGTPVIEFVRVADALNPRVSQLFNLGGVNYAGFSGGKAADFQSTALSLRLPGASIQILPPPANAQTFLHFGNFLLCGQPDDAVQGGQYVPGIVVKTPTTLDIVLSGLLNHLSNAAPQYGFMGLDYTQPLIATGTWTIFNVQFWQFTATAHGWSTGDRIRITGANSLGFDGTYKVNVIDANTVSLTNGPRTALPAPTQASARRVQTAAGTRFLQFYRYQIPQGGWNSPFGIKISKKNPGREFLGVSFTKRKRRPK